MEIDYVNQKLIAGTFSRSMFSYDISWIDNLGTDFTGVQTNKQVELNVYPNPVVNQLIIKTSEKGNFKLYNANGKLVMNKTISNNITELNVSQLPKGVYFYQLNNAKGKLIKG